ncbi:MAG: GlsB/YeaQ/YmgE family stress response membrane protein [Acidobacteriota bacterium]|nr:GlsB/YeaQ/YmgE family stress response membrane protein [Acidobacteriota bacterium]
MSYLIVIIVGAVVGFVAGQYLKGSEHGKAIDAVVGGVGACVFVLLSRMVGPAGAAGWFMSTVVTIIGAVLTLFIMRQFMIRKAVPVSKPRRRF